MPEKYNQSVDVVIVGAGFAGLYALHKMNQMGLSAVVFEAADGIGGTWYWNPYPGARCDVESFEYSYSFDKDLQQSWRWSERYATQPEILRYLKHVAERFNLMPQIRLGTRVQSAHWQENYSNWQLETTDGTVTGRFLVMATGCLSQPNIPQIKGMDSFKGKIFHSGHWPQEGIELSGKRVGVIGSGSSGVQVVSNIAPQVASLHVFQRTPHWVVRAGNRSIGTQEDQEVKGRYPEFREQLASSLLGMGVKSLGGAALDASEEERRKRYEAAWQKGGASYLMCFDDLLVNTDANVTACSFLAEKIRSIVSNSATAAALIPDSSRYPIGGRRLVMDDNYYSRFNLPNVHLEDTRQDPIREITADGITLQSGRQIVLDVIILATGFDALTGALLKIDIKGKEGRSLREKWADAPYTYLGLTLQGFPNFFTITGPGSPSVFSNVVLSIEQHVEFVAGLMGWMQEHQLGTVEAQARAEQAWGERVMEVARPTVLMKVESSWYWGANVAGKPKVFLPYLGGVGTYRDECSAIVRNGYTGFVFDS